MVKISRQTVLCPILPSQRGKDLVSLYMSFGIIFTSVTPQKLLSLFPNLWIQADTEVLDLPAYTITKDPQF